MKYFYAIVHKDRDSAFGVQFPDLPGCFSAADELEDVLPNAVEALELWFEDADEVPEPAPVERVQAALAEEQAHGDAAFLLAVPYIRSAGRAVKANISLDRGMLDAIDAAAPVVARLAGT